MKRTRKCPLEQERAEQESKENGGETQQKGEHQDKKQQEFCFLKGELVDCNSGRVQDCNMKRTKSCPLEKDAFEENRKNKGDTKRQPEEKNTGGGKRQDFCFLKGELVDCSSGRVQDCNMKRTKSCPLEKDAFEENRKNKGDTKKQPEKKPAGEGKHQDFCFLKGELVDCSSGRVQDCNMKRTKSCPLEKDAFEENRKNKGDTKGQPEEKATSEGKHQDFCFLKGELVDCSSGRVQDCNMKRTKSCPLEKDAFEENRKNKGDTKKQPEEKTTGEGKHRDFCFLKGELVDCSSGRIQDCNIKRVRKCPKE